MVNTLTIILGLIGAVILGVIIFQILKYLKGSVKIKLDKTSFSSGEQVTGIVSLKAKKEIQSNRLYVELEAMRKEKTRNANGKNSSTWRKIYSQQVNLEEEKSYSGGFEKDYSFKIKVPTNKEVGTLSTGNQVVDSVIKVASYAVGVGRLKWKLRVRLDAKGVDLTSSKKINVNLS